MSLLLKALKQAERNARPAAPEWSLEPQETSGETPPRPAQAAADLIRAHGEPEPGNRRLVILLVLLVSVVVGLAGYFYVAVYMPWLLLPRPAPATPAAPSPAPTPLQPQVSPLPAVPPLESGPPRLPAGSQPDAATRSPELPAPKSAAPARAEPDRPLVRPASVPVAPGALAVAHSLLQAGRIDEAAQAYEKLRVTDPDNPDVLLGLAVLAEQRGEREEAARLYARVLESDPRNAYAQAALIALIGMQEPAAAEARLRALIARQPAAYLHFALGNLLAAQGRWSEAQAAYFEAQRLEPDAADYAFNLAVSLDHLGQARAAADYYQRALQLRQAGGGHFDPAQAVNRLQQLSR